MNLSGRMGKIHELMSKMYQKTKSNKHEKLITSLINQQSRVNSEMRVGDRGRRHVRYHKYLIYSVITVTITKSSSDNICCHLMKP